MRLLGTKYFKLEKHYLDCIDNEGNCFIVYHAELHILFICISYSALLFSDHDNLTVEKTSLRKPGKLSAGELLKFSHPGLKINGRWQGTGTSLPHLLLRDDSNHELVWNCHHPKTVTEIVYDNHTFQGFGYADTILISFRPGNLPIDELKWGRFHSEKSSVIWIRISGGFPVNKIYLNGTEYSDASFEKDRIAFNNGDYLLMLSENSVIREGKLADIFSEMPWLKIFFDKKILNTHEVKYKSKAILSFKNKISEYGWSVYETVTWKK
jgi:hypothetical protein